MWIALLSDFGTADHYVGAMKGVLARLAPTARVIDVTHQIPPFDLVRGGLALHQAYPHFPRKTCFVAVVDPGVGGERRALLVETQDYYFLGPDNGVLAMALAEQKIRRIVELNNEKYFLKPKSATFHGRDVFAPVAAHLAQGLGPEFFGPELTEYQRLSAFSPAFDSKAVTGQILAFDRFGNALTNLSRAFLQRRYQRPEWRVEVGGRTLQGLRGYYAEVAAGETLLLFGSGGLLEIAVREGSAEATLGLKRGDSVVLPL